MTTYSGDYYIEKHKFLIQISVEFSGEKYASMSSGIASVFSYDNEDWKSVAAGDFDISDYISQEKLINLLFGDLWGRFITYFLQFLSYCSGVHFLIWIVRKLFKTKNSCFQRPIEIKVEQPNIRRKSCYEYGSDDYSVQIDSENCYRRQAVAFKRAKAEHDQLITIESEDEEGSPPPYTCYKSKFID